MTESLSNQSKTLDLANEISKLTDRASGVSNVFHETGVLYASHHYRDLSTAAEQLGDEGQLLLEIGTLFIEANTLLTQLSNLENQKGKKINAKLADSKEPIVKRLEEVKKKIAEFEKMTKDNPTLQKLKGDEKFKPLFAQQNKIRDKLLEQTKGTSKAESKRESEEEEGTLNEIVETVEVPNNTATTGIGVIKRFDAVLHTKLHTTDELTHAGKAQVFKMGLVISFLAIPYLAISAFNSMAKVGKTIIKAADIKGQLKEIEQQKESLNIRLALIKDEQSKQKEPKLATKLVQTRNELEKALEKLSAEELELQQKLKGTPLTATLKSVPVLGTMTELTGRALELVKIFFEHGARIGAGTIGRISMALHVLGPVAAAISTIISGAMLRRDIKKLGKLNEQNEKLKREIGDAESRMNPNRLHLKKELEGFKAELALKKLTPERRKELETNIEEHKNLLEVFPNEDFVDEFFEMEADRLKVELLANNRDIGLMRLSVANSTVLTLGGMVSFAATIGSPAFAVTTSLYGVALTLFGVSLGLSIAHYIKSKRSAKSLLIKQEPYKLSEQALNERSHTIAEGLTTRYKKGDQSKGLKTIHDKKDNINAMWDRMTERNPALNKPTPEQRYDPDYIQDAVKQHFSSLQQQPKSEKTPE